MSEERRALSRRQPVVLYSFLVFLLVVLFLSFLVFRPFLLTFAVSASVAILLSPLNGRLIRALRGRRTLAAGLLVSLSTLVILLPLLSYAILIGNQAATLIGRVEPGLEPEAIERLWAETLPARYPWLAEVKDWLQLDKKRVAEILSPALSRLASGASRLFQGALARLTQALLELVLFLIILFFLLRDGHLLGAALKSISPLSEAQEDELYGHLAKTVKGVLQSMVLVPLVQGLLAMLGFSIFGLPAPLFWGAMLIFAAVIPGVGSPLVWVPATVYLFMSGPAWRGVGLLLYGTLVISTIDNIIKPIILREAARIHPLLAFLAIFGGIISFGVLGFLIGPVILSLLLSAIRMYRLDLLRSGLGSLESATSPPEGGLAPPPPPASAIEAPESREF